MGSSGLLPLDNSLEAGDEERQSVLDTLRDFDIVIVDKQKRRKHHGRKSKSFGAADRRRNVGLVNDTSDDELTSKTSTRDKLPRVSSVKMGIPRNLEVDLEELKAYRKARRLCDAF